MSDFTGDGFEGMPNIYGDNQQVRDFPDWAPDVLEARIATYNAFLRRTDLMPRAKAGAERVVRHALFELSWRLIDEAKGVEDVEVLSEG